MTYTAIPVPADRYDSAFQPATTVQSWKKQKTVDMLSSAESRTAARAVHLDRGSNPVESMMADAPESKSGFAGELAEANGKTENSDFEFDDFLDIINPLHHLPVIGMIYRSITGDTIKPVASIVGGGIFGGPVGAASGVANAIVQHETGKDIAGNVFALVMDDDGNSGSSNSPVIASGFKDDPETQLSMAAASHGLSENLEVDHQAPPPPFAGKEAPGTAMSFADVKAGMRAYEKTAIAGGRTAGWHLDEVERAPPAPVTDKPFDARALVDRALPAREPMTTVSLNDFPPIY